MRQLEASDIYHSGSSWNRKHPIIHHRGNSLSDLKGLPPPLSPNLPRSMSRHIRARSCRTGHVVANKIDMYHRVSLVPRRRMIIAYVSEATPYPPLTCISCIIQYKTTVPPILSMTAWLGFDYLEYMVRGRTLVYIIELLSCPCFLSPFLSFGTYQLVSRHTYSICPVLFV